MQASLRDEEPRRLATTNAIVMPGIFQWCGRSRVRNAAHVSSTEGMLHDNPPCITCLRQFFNAALSRSVSWAVRALDGDAIFTPKLGAGERLKLMY